MSCRCFEAVSRTYNVATIMKLLFLTSRFPFPLEKGDKLRSYYFLRELSRKHQVILVSLNETPVSEEHKQHIAEMVHSLHIFPLKRFSRTLNTFFALFQRRPLQAGYFYSRKARKAVLDIIQSEQPDHVFCQLLRTALLVKNINIPKTLDYQDVFSYGVKRRIPKSNVLMSIILRIEYHKLRKFEERIFHWFDHTTIITETDRALMSVKDPNAIHIVSNGVDFEYFNPDLFQSTEKKYDLLFTGNMGYPPNVNCATYIAKEVMPAIRNTYPGLRVAFAGANPAPAVVRFQSDHIHVTGWVEDIRPYYASSLIFLAPMQIGTGLQNKLLEAMAMGMPCITSSLANAALGAEPETHLLVGDSPNEIASHIEKLLTDATFRSRIAENGKTFVRERFSWKTQAERLEQLFHGEKENNS